jgi:hypothetical protein
MIENPTDEIIFMNIMTLICELSGLRSDSHYSIENKDKDDIHIMSLNPNYNTILNHVKNIFESSDEEYKYSEINNVVVLLNKINTTLKLQLKNVKKSKFKKIEEIKNVEELLHFTAFCKDNH